MSETARNKYKGEAIFLRAYYHYLLADNWGSVPLRLSSNKTVTDVNIAATAAQDVFSYVVKDMEEVVNNEML